MNLSGMIIGHLVGDYLLQNDWMAKNKTSSTLVCLIHAGLWTEAVRLLEWDHWYLLQGGPVSFWLLVSHFLIDRYRLAWRSMAYTGQLAFRDGPLSPWSIIVVDNTWHLVTIWIAWAVCGFGQ